MWYAKSRMVAKACRTRGKILNKDQQGFRCSVEVLRNFAAIGVKNGSRCCEVNGRLSMYHMNLKKGQQGLYLFGILCTCIKTAC